MKRLALVIAVSLLAVAARGADAAPTIVFDQLPLIDVIKNLGRASGINFIIDPRVAGATFGAGHNLASPIVSARYTNFSASAALVDVLKQNNLVMVTNLATTVSRIAPANAGVKPVEASEVARSTNGPVPLIVIDDVTFIDTVNNMARQEGLEVTFDPRVLDPKFKDQGTISVRWQDLTVRQALAALLDNCDLKMVEALGPGRAHIMFKTPKAHPAPAAR